MITSTDCLENHNSPLFPEFSAIKRLKGDEEESIKSQG